MTRTGKLLAGLILAGDSGGRPSRTRADEAIEPQGVGPAYEQLGKVAVMHEGRVKPLDTVAREEVKQVYSRETITLRDPREEIAKLLDPERYNKLGGTACRSRWGPVSAFLGWTVRPEFWDDQPFILVDYLPLAGTSWPETIAARLKAIAGSLARSAEDRSDGRSWATTPNSMPHADAIRPCSKLPVEDRQDDRRAGRKAHRRAQVADAARAGRGDDHHQGGEMPALSEWAARWRDRHEKFHEDPNRRSAPEIEKRAMEVLHPAGGLPGL